MSDFYPISPLIAIPNSSYAAQAGVMEEKWAVRVVRGKKILSEKTTIELQLENLVGLIFASIKVPGISRALLAQTAGRMMQFARKYQQSGVCPNYENPDLIYDDGSGEIVESSTGAPAEAPTQEVAAAQPTLTPNPIGKLPEIPNATGSKGWDNLLEAHSILLGELASYGASLPEGHLDVMVNRVVDLLLWMWTSSGDPYDPVIKYGQLIMSCSKESQTPSTTTGMVRIETGTCAILAAARQFDPDGTRIPAGYPCKFHELLAEKVSHIAGIIVDVNTSSTGCIVTMKIEG
jgi:hypothetical protein